MDRDAGCGLLQAAELDVLEPYRHRWSAVDLERDHTIARRFFGLLIDHFNRHRAVDEVLQLVPVGHDTKVIPLAWVNSRTKRFRVAESRLCLFAIAADRDRLATLGQNATALLFVQDPGVPIPKVDVGLMMLIGLPTSIVGVLVCKIINRLIDIPMRPYAGQEEPDPLDENQLPPFWISFAPIALDAGSFAEGTAGWFHSSV